MNEEVKIYDVKQAADRLKVSTNVIYKLVRENLIHHTRIGSLIRITEKDIQKFLGVDDGQN